VCLGIYQNLTSVASPRVHISSTCKVGQKLGSVSPTVDMLPFGVTIPAAVPQGSEIPEGLTNNPVYISEHGSRVKLPDADSQARLVRVWPPLPLPSTLYAKYWVVPVDRIYERPYDDGYPSLSSVHAVSFVIR
jgi:hypothetical protein